MSPDRCPLTGVKNTKSKKFFRQKFSKSKNFFFVKSFPVLLSCYPGKAEGGALGPPSCPPVSSGKTIELVTCNLNL